MIAEVRHGSTRTGDQQRLSQAFPLGTPLNKIKAWQLRAKGGLILDAPAAPGRGTLAGDIPTLLEQHIPEGRYREDLRALLAHWAASPLGARARMAITRADVIAQRKRWLDAGHAINSCNKRLSALRVLYHTLDATVDGAVPPCPADDVTYLKEPEAEARAIPLPAVRLILDSISDLGRAERGQTRPTVSHTKLRLRVFAWTAAAPATIARVERKHIDLEGARIFLTARRKGKGTPGKWVPLLPEAVEALRAWLDAGLLGTQGSNSSMGKSWRIAIKVAIETARRRAAEPGDPDDVAQWKATLSALEELPPNSHPYDLRHSFGDEMYRVTGDVRAVSELLQHASLETTKRYTVRAVSDRAVAAVAKMSAAMAAAPRWPPATPVQSPAAARGLRLVKKQVS